MSNIELMGIWNIGDRVAKPIFWGIWNKNVSLGDGKRGCLIQTLHFLFHWWRGEKCLSHVFHRFHGKRGHEHLV